MPIDQILSNSKATIEGISDKFHICRILFKKHPQLLDLARETVEKFFRDNPKELRTRHFELAVTLSKTEQLARVLMLWPSKETGNILHPVLDDYLQRQLSNDWKKAKVRIAQGKIFAQKGDWTYVVEYVHDTHYGDFIRKSNYWQGRLHTESETKIHQ